MSLEKADSNVGLKIGFAVVGTVVAIVAILHWFLLFVGLGIGYGAGKLTKFFKND